MTVHAQHSKVINVSRQTLRSTENAAAIVSGVSQEEMNLYILPHVASCCIKYSQSGWNRGADSVLNFYLLLHYNRACTENGLQTCNVGES